MSDTPPPLRFLSPIHRATRQIGLHLERRLAALELAPVEGHLLTYLLAWSPAPISELAKVFGLKGSTLTSLLDRLAGRGLLERVPNPDDRRSVLIVPTEAGRELGERVNGPVRALESEIARRVAEEDRLAFDRVLAAIAAATGVEVRRRGRRPESGKERR